MSTWSGNEGRMGRNQSISHPCSLVLPGAPSESRRQPPSLCWPCLPLFPTRPSSQAFLLSLRAGLQPAAVLPVSALFLWPLLQEAFLNGTFQGPTLFHFTPQTAPPPGCSEFTSLVLSVVRPSASRGWEALLSDAHFPVPSPGTLGLRECYTPGLGWGIVLHMIRF